MKRILLFARALLLVAVAFTAGVVVQKWYGFTDRGKPSETGSGPGSQIELNYDVACGSDNDVARYLEFNSEYSLGARYAYAEVENRTDCPIQVRVRLYGKNLPLPFGSTITKEWTFPIPAGAAARVEIAAADNTWEAPKPQWMTQIPRQGWNQWNADRTASCGSEFAGAAYHGWLFTNWPTDSPTASQCVVDDKCKVPGGGESFAVIGCPPELFEP